MLEEARDVWCDRRHPLPPIMRRSEHSAMSTNNSGTAPSHTLGDVPGTKHTVFLRMWVPGKTKRFDIVRLFECQDNHRNGSACVLRYSAGMPDKAGG